MNKIINLLLVATVLVIGCAKGNRFNVPSNREITLFTIVETTPTHDNTKSSDDIIMENAKFMLVHNASSDLTLIQGEVAKFTGSRQERTGNIIFTGSRPSYDKTDLYAYMLGYWPEGVTDTGSSVDWEIDGSKDLLISNIWAAGKASAPSNGTQTPMTFKHRLAQLEVKCQIELGSNISFVREQWGKITRIELMETSQTATLKYGSTSTSNAITFSTIKKNKSLLQPDYTSLFAPADIQTQDDTNPMAVGMFAPSTGKITLRITSTGSDANNEIVRVVPVQLYDNNISTDFAAGNKYIVTLTLRVASKQIDVTQITVTDWTTGYSASDETLPRELQIGDYADGGIVYFIDPANKNNYRVLALKEPQNEAGDVKKMQWTPMVDLRINSNKSKDENDGHNNVEAMLTYSREKLGSATGVFAIDFPAADYCYNHKGNSAKDPVGTWYLPSKNELYQLYDQYYNNMTVIDAAITTYSGSPFFSQKYWSGTEENGGVDKVFEVDFLGDHNWNSGTQTFNIRCVNSVGSLPSPPSSPPITSRYTIGEYVESGIVFWLDPVSSNSCKVFAIDEAKVENGTLKKFKWCTVENLYINTVDSKDQNDGRKNTNAMQAYSMAKKGGTTGVFSNDFPAADYCNDYRGHNGTDPIGTWYLPSKNELLVITNLWGYENTTTTRQLLTNAINDNGGSLFVYGWYWSGTESNSQNQIHYSFLEHIGPNSTYPGTHTCNIRCIKIVQFSKPPLTVRPAVGNFAYDNGTYSSTNNTNLNCIGIIFWVDPTNPKNYKILSLKEPTSIVKKELWSIRSTYVIESTRQNEDGRSNVLAMKNYSSTHTGDVNIDARTIGLFGYDFPAAGYCNTVNSSAVNQNKWYLPSKTELQHLWCAYNGVAPSTTPIEVAINLTQQTKWNNKIIMQKGDILSAVDYLSSTESSDNNSNVWYGNFSDGVSKNLRRKDELFNIRCIMSTLPMPSVPNPINSLSSKTTRSSR